MVDGATAAFEGQHVLVTGGGRGIGRAIARAFVQHGATVTVTGRTETHLIDAVAAGDAHGYAKGDVTEETELRHAIAQAARGRGAVDVLIANAGAAESGPFLKSDSHVFRRMLDLNVMGVVHAVHAVLPDMVTRGRGRVIVIASTAGLKGYGYVTAYTAAKHAAVGLVKALAIEIAATGVTINAVCPGYTATEMVASSVAKIAAKTGKSAEDALAGILKDNPLKRLIMPDEVAAACLYLASPAAAAVNGSALVIAGGEV
jgi:NAD(P)-dependent dehydrogenase (short-subunit alcohol dehydrogenase family)